MFSTQHNIKDLFASNTRSVIRGTTTDSHSESRDSQFPYSQVDFPDSQMPNSQLSSQSSESPGKRHFGRFVGKGSLKSRDASVRGQGLIPQSNYQHSIQLQKAKAKERDERDHLLAALNCIREEVKSTVIEIRNGVEIESRASQEFFLKHLTQLHAGLEHYNENWLKVFDDRDELKKNIAQLQKQMSEKDATIGRLELAIEEYREQQNHMIIEELQKSLFNECDKTKKHFDSVYEEQNRETAEHNEKLQNQLSCLTQQNQEHFRDVIQQTTSKLENVAQDLCNEVKNQAASHQRELIGLQQEIQKQLNHSDRHQREDIKALLRQQMQLLDLSNEKVFNQFLDLQTRQLADLQTFNKENITEYVKENVKDSADKQKAEVRDMIQELWNIERCESKEKQTEYHNLLENSINSRCKTIEDQMNKQSQRYSNGFASQEHQQQSSKSRRFLRRSYSDMTAAHSDTECFSSFPHRSVYNSPLVKRNNPMASFGDNDQAFQRKIRLRSQSQSDLSSGFTQNNCRDEAMYEPDSLVTGARNTTKLAENHRILLPNRQSNGSGLSHGIGFRQEQSHSAATKNELHRHAHVTHRFLSPVLRDRAWTAKELFSKFNPSPSPVATVRPQVQTLAKETQAQVRSSLQNDNPAGEPVRVPMESQKHGIQSVKPQASVPITTQAESKTRKTQPKRGRKRKGSKRWTQTSKRGKRGNEKIHQEPADSNRQEGSTALIGNEDSHESQDEGESQCISNRFHIDLSNQLQGPLSNATNIYEFKDEISQATELNQKTRFWKKSNSTYEKPKQDVKNRVKPTESERLWDQMKNKAKVEPYEFASPVISNGSESQQDETDLSSVGSSPSYSITDVMLRTEPTRQFRHDRTRYTEDAVYANKSASLIDGEQGPYRGAHQRRMRKRLT